MTPEFKPFPKMPRLNREIMITEKIDGTNASILIREITDPEEIAAETMDPMACVRMNNLLIYAGSRTGWITPDKDNHRFARWVCENDEELVKLGVGHHFGEWWGSGIQRGYGLSKGEKRFSLFNAIRWAAGDDPIGIASTSWNDKTRQMEQKLQERAPACCHVVPVLYRGLFSTERVQFELDALHDLGSRAAPDFKNPEGVVVFHIAGNTGFKITLDNDNEPKRKYQQP